MGDDPFSVHCPKCGAKKGKPCTYMPLSAAKTMGWMSPNLRRRLDRVGTPTQRPHVERIHSYGNQVGQQYRERRLTYRPVPADTAAAAVALRELDRREAVYLTAWLRTYGDIFASIEMDPN
jgi:hypothetical protein